MPRVPLVALGAMAAWSVANGLLGSLAKADLIYFAKGGEVQAPARTEGTKVVLDTPDGPQGFLRRDFRRLVPGHWPPAEWESKRALALKGDVVGRFAAAWWALENGLTPEAVAMLHDAAAADRGHAPTARMIAALDRLARPSTDPDLGVLRRALGESAGIARGPHVVLIHQHSEEEAAERIALLERVVTTYYLLLASHGLELPPPARRLASAWFAEHRDYQEFLRTEGAEVFQTTRGYFHPTLNVVVAYDARSAGAQKSAREAFAGRRDDLRRLGEAIDRLPANGRLRFEVRGEPLRTLNRAQARGCLDDLERDLRRRQLLLDMDRRAVNLGTAAHEMVHQLVAASGFAPRHDDFPLWLHEGFAAQFEVIRGGRWAGVGRAHDIRLPDWRSIRPSPPLLPLLQDSGFGRGYRRDLYAQSWALVYFLRKAHPEEFLAFVDRLRLPRSNSAPHDDRVLSSFRIALGRDLETTEAAWYRFMNPVRTPLEELRAEATSRPPGPLESATLRD